MRKEFLLALALLWTGVILFFCLIKSSAVPVVKIPNLDKAVHFVFHFVFTLLWYFYFQKQYKATPFKKLIGVAFVFSVVFGIGIEVAQSLFTTTRSGDVLDVLANTIGAFLAGYSVWFYYSKKINL